MEDLERRFGGVVRGQIGLLLVCGLRPLGLLVIDLGLIGARVWSVCLLDYRDKLTNYRGSTGKAHSAKAQNDSARRDVTARWDVTGSQNF